MVLKVNNLSLPLKWTPMGPLLSTEDKYLAPLAWLINPPVASQNSEFVDSLARGDDVFIQTHFAVRPAPEEVQPEDWARWRELTGSELGEDVYMVGTTFTHEVILPRKTLQEIVQSLLKKRAEFPEPPFPWLFRADPYDFAPAEGEKELLGELEKRAVALKRPTQETVAEISRKRKELLRDLEDAGLFSEEYSEEKQLWLEVWEYSTLHFYYNGYINFMQHIRQALFLEPSPVLDMSLSIRVPKHAPHSTTAGQVVYSQLAHA